MHSGLYYQRKVGNVSDTRESLLVGLGSEYPEIGSLFAHHVYVFQLQCVPQPELA
ncbi:hypothetical protein F2Q69_00043657 [Brassica cretica]|uniref:Uncharacterized protein n=1 Tax=Brassica cretica TaxID=69181 RepID=A0A8S9NRJ9_BRACR|nr:hypothetical protein F2Q69_00043657 [Brassica cretica]